MLRLKHEAQRLSSKLPKSIALGGPTAYRSEVLERVALNQTRFRTPGLSPELRGVLLGELGLVLFSSLDRAVAFLRAYSHSATLDELVPTLRITQLLTSLKTREIAISFSAESTMRMDRVATIARLAHGFVFTGSATHFVKYRDAASPLGYDVSATSRDAGDFILYHDSFEQAYQAERVIALRDLVLRLLVEPVPYKGELPGSLLVTAERGIAPAVLRTLARAGVEGSVSELEWPRTSAFDDTTRVLRLFTLDNLPPRYVSLLSSLPGVTVFVPVGKGVAVELGHRHPLALDSAMSLFDESDLVLFRAKSVDVLKRPVSVPLSTLTTTDRASLSEAPSIAASTHTNIAGFSIPLRLRPTNEPLRRVHATVVPVRAQEWLAKLFYLVPRATLDALRVARTASKIYVIAQQTIDEVPIGTFLTELAPRVYVPAGWAIEPALSRELLVSLLSLSPSAYAFFDLETNAIEVVEESAFTSASHLMRSEMPATVVTTEPWQNQNDASPELVYGERTSLPLWGAPGQEPTPKDES